MDELAADRDATVTQILARVIVRAEQSARQTATFLKLWCREKRLRDDGEWPAEFLAELGAVLEVGQWQRLGQIPESLKDVPPWHQLLDELLFTTINRVERQVSEPLPSPSPLQRRVFCAWLEESVWLCPPSTRLLLSAEVGDELLDLIAHFLWNHRHLVMKEFADES